MFRFEAPVIMGILNVTPDSFSDGGSYRSVQEAVDKAFRMVEEGAVIIDVGGESTRPFAAPVSIREETERVLPVIREIAGRIKVPVSIDTRHPSVATAALDSGASIVNDVCALQEPGMDRVVAERGATAVLMHMKGTPREMQVSPVYEDVIREIHSFLNDRVGHMESLGCSREDMFIDPGIGFGKRLRDNLTILRDLGHLRDIGCPILVGASRKSFIGSILDAQVGDRLEGSLSSAVIAVMNGASMVRVHDIRETRRALDILKAIQHPDRFL